MVLTKAASKVYPPGFAVRLQSTSSHCSCQKHVGFPCLTLCVYVCVCVLVLCVGFPFWFWLQGDRWSMIAEYVQTHAHTTWRRSTKVPLCMCMCVCVCVCVCVSQA